MKYTLTTIFSLLFVYVHAQLDSIYDQGQYRTFILHLPSGYTPAVNYPIVINMHGLNSNATEQQIYSQFDQTANQEGFIVAYPNAIDESWSLFNDLDVNFISNLIDTLNSRYSTNDCLFFTGMSDGGFMSYKLACDLPRPITAIASVTGNMTTILQASCAVDGGIPIMDFHGTADAVVPYNGTFGIPPIENTMQYWVSKNETDQLPEVIEMPDTNPNDQSTVTRYAYLNGINGSSVIFYKVNNGGHTWPGTFDVPSLGNTNHDIFASTIIGEFFSYYCDIASSTETESHHSEFSVLPNPSQGWLHVQLPGQTFDLKIFDINGRLLKVFNQVKGEMNVDASLFDMPLLILRCEVNHQVVGIHKAVIIR